VRISSLLDDLNASLDSESDDGAWGPEELSLAIDKLEGAEQGVQASLRRLRRADRASETRIRVSSRPRELGEEEFGGVPLLLSGGARTKVRAKAYKLNRTA
jgi:hypothetical protein